MSKERSKESATSVSGKKSASRWEVLETGKAIMPRGLYIRTRLTQQDEAKKRIAVHVAENYVRDFDAVLLDAGSTAEFIAEEMFARRKFLSVMTNNMGAYAAYTRAREAVEAGVGQAGRATEDELPNRGNELLITGGRYVDIYESLLGEGAISSIIDFIPNVIIIGNSGLRCEEGIFCHGAEESAVKQLLWTKSVDTRLIATDWTKIGKRDAHSFGPVEELAVNAKKAVIVTCSPPRKVYEKDPDRAKEFEEQIRKLSKFNIVVDKL